MIIYCRNVYVDLHKIITKLNETQIIWNKCSRKVFVEGKTLEIGIYSARLKYNDGTFSIQNVLKRFNVISGVCFEQRSVNRNLKSVNTSKWKSSDEGKKSRKTIGKIKKSFPDKEKEIEDNESNVSGGFWSFQFLFLVIIIYISILHIFEFTFLHFLLNFETL